MDLSKVLDNQPKLICVWKGGNNSRYRLTTDGVSTYLQRSTDIHGNNWENMSNKDEIIAELMRQVVRLTPDE